MTAPGSPPASATEPRRCSVPSPVSSPPLPMSPLDEHHHAAMAAAAAAADDDDIEALPDAEPAGEARARRRSEARHFLEEQAEQRQFTVRAVVVGLLVGTVVCFSNMYFGLQTGWVSMMSMPSSLIGFAIFKALGAHLQLPFTPVENVLVQTVAVAVGSMPLSAGFVGVIPALETLLKPEEGGPVILPMGKLIFWSLGVAFFGVFFAVPLRRQVLIREKLKFPSGTATALMISVLHGREGSTKPSESAEGERRVLMASGVEGVEGVEGAEEDDAAERKAADWAAQTRLLLIAFGVSGVYTLLTYFIPALRDLPIFGHTAAASWLWTLNPSPAYVGQGIIMGTETTLHMLLGAVLGWGILSPIAKSRGWAPGPVSDWVTGSRGWIVWVSLAIMLADSVVSLGGLVLEPVIRHAAARWYQPEQRGSYMPIATSPEPAHADGEPTPASLRRRRRSKTAADAEPDDAADEDAPAHHQVPTGVVVVGLAASGVLCIGAIRVVFGAIPFYATLLAFVLALLLSVMGVRALGQTDLNPVSGISKLTQLVFALLPLGAAAAGAPSPILINLVAGAVSEAGAQQAGDIMQDLKTGHLLGAAPRAQFYGQLVGGAVGAAVSAGVYRLYTRVYPVPGALFQVPTAYVWIDCSRLVFGAGLPAGVRGVAAAAAALAAAATVARACGRGRGRRWRACVPGGIAVAVGMYNVPSFTIARAVGGLVQAAWARWRRGRDTELVILASGLILGEGIVSVVNLAMASAGVPHL